ncbi:MULTISPECIES: Clp protease N-terminal domain-containing protein [Acidovorax]|uniref:Clp protease N-terminal domain-containing protein n=1 Tax=Acidovorax TaxID=12916 RepID=UPI0002375C4B|nr:MULTISPECIES: Clp protease N-terminal domain-containing protein [Acidovorax]KRD22189.1 peptidase [Acidovorax sp. Root267]
MFRQLQHRFQSMRTLSCLCTSAEAHARASGQAAPGAEHFLLAAIDLPEGSARRALESVGADPAAVRDAIEQQYRDALQDMGLNATLPQAPALAPPVPGLYRAQPSGQEVMQTLARSRKDQGGPLLGAHVVAVVATMPQGVAARTLRAMGIDAGQLAAAAQSQVPLATGAAA